MSDVDTTTTVTWRDYLELCKPNVVALMILTSVIGMLLATDGFIPWEIFVFGNLGIALCAGSAAAVNHIVDRNVDDKMARTANRPIAQGRLDPQQASDISPLSLASLAWLFYAGVHQCAHRLANVGLFGRLRLRVHHVFKACHATEYRDWRSRRRRATPIRLGSRDRRDSSQCPAARADYLCLDPAAFLGASDTPQRGIRQSQHSHAARDPWRAIHQD